MVAASSHPREVIGIDVGGTKTHLALGHGGSVTKEWTLSTPSWRTHSLDDNAVALYHLVRDWLGDQARQGLAGDAGRTLRIHATAGRFLRSQPDARCARAGLGALL
jgi:hypothetical protein